MSTRFYDTDLTNAALAWIAPVLRGAGQTSDLAPQALSFGSIRINGTTYEYDVVIDRGHVSKRNKKPSKKFRSKFGHTPLSIQEDIPWKCQRLVVGTGTGALPIMDEVNREAHRREIELVVLPTTEAIKRLQDNPDKTNAILHVRC